MRAVIYCRISRDPSGHELGVRRQETDCRALCEREGYDIAAVHVDDDRSAYSGKPRPAFNAMVQQITEGNIDVLVAWHPDRITRQPRELEDIIDLLDRTNTTVRTVQTGEYDLSTPSGRMAARIVGAVARHESEHKSARLRRKHVELAEAGQNSGGGTRPFGYEQDRMTVRAEEAVILRDLAARALAGDSLRSLCRHLAALGIVGPGGAPWSQPKLRRTLTSARIAGLRSHRGVVTAEAAWPAIITVEQHYRLVALLRDPSRRSTEGGLPRKLLTGVLECGLCGLRMMSRPRDDGRPAYICAKPPQGKGCGKMFALAEPVEALVVAAVLARAAELELTIEPAEDDSLLIELQQIRTRRDELATMWADGLPQREFLAATSALEKRESAVSAALSAQVAREAAVVDLVALGERWPSMPHDRRRVVLKSMLARVVVNPGVPGRNTFDPSRFVIEWAS